MNALRRLFLTPTALILVILFFAPLAIIVAYSFVERGAYGGVTRNFTWQNYTRLADPLYVAIYARTFALAAAATAACVAMGFPLALFISRAGSRKNLYLQLVTLPFWTSFLIRTYAWMFLLRDTGLFNTVLQALGIIQQPLPLLYNDGAVFLGLLYAYLPFVVLPLYATLERLDPVLLEAAADMGARPLEVVWRIVIPLCGPGFRAAALLVFIPCLGTYLISDLLGGSRTVLLGNLIQNQFTTARDWPFGSAVALAVMAVVLVILLQLRGREGDDFL